MKVREDRELVTVAFKLSPQELEKLRELTFANTSAGAVTIVCRQVLANVGMKDSKKANKAKEVEGGVK